MSLRWNQRGVAYWSDGAVRRTDLLGHRRRLPDCGGRQDRPPVRRLRRQRPRRSDGRPAARQARHARLPQRAHLLRAVAANRRRRRHHRAGLDLVAGLQKEQIPGFIRGYDVRTGKVRWTFQTVPQPGETGHDSWKDNSWEYAGKVTVWTMMSADEELGYVYLPTNTTAPDFYGGHRPGDNLFAESLLCLDVEDRAARLALSDRAPRPVGLRQPRRAEPARHHRQRPPHQGGGADHQAGVRLHLRPRHRASRCGRSSRSRCRRPTCPAKRASPTQPFPTRPAPFESQGVTRRRPGRLHAGTARHGERGGQGVQAGPAVHAAVTEAARSRGPARSAARNWSGAAVDPQTGMIYIPSRNGFGVSRWRRPTDARRATCSTCRRPVAARRCRRGCRCSSRRTRA